MKLEDEEKRNQFVFLFYFNVDERNPSLLVCFLFLLLFLFLLEDEQFKSLIESLGFAHGRFDVECSNVLPVLLQQRNKKVDRQVDVRGQFVR